MTDENEGRHIQDHIRKQVDTSTILDYTNLRLIAGADAAYSDTHIFAGIVVMSFPDLAIIEKRCGVHEVTFPYIPGLLAFREGPALAEAFFQLVNRPDVLFVNGHGYSHPSRVGLASHLGVAVNVPTIGVAKKILAGVAEEPGFLEGSLAPVLDGGEIIGMAVRTRHGSKPVFVSAGHRIDLDSAVRLTIAAIGENRFPEPLRCADVLSSHCRRRATPA